MNEWRLVGSLTLAATKNHALVSGGEDSGLDIITTPSRASIAAIYATW